MILNIYTWFESHWKCKSPFRDKIQKIYCRNYVGKDNPLNNIFIQTQYLPYYMKITWTYFCSAFCPLEIKKNCWLIDVAMLYYPLRLYSTSCKKEIKNPTIDYPSLIQKKCHSVFTICQIILINPLYPVRTFLIHITYYITLPFIMGRRYCNVLLSNVHKWVPSIIKWGLDQKPYQKKMCIIIFYYKDNQLWKVALLLKF